MAVLRARSLRREAVSVSVCINSGSAKTTLLLIGQLESSTASRVDNPDPVSDYPDGSPGGNRPNACHSHRSAPRDHA